MFHFINFSNSKFKNEKKANALVIENRKDDEFLSPEQKVKDELNESSDVFSLGKVFLYLIERYEIDINLDIGDILKAMIIENLENRSSITQVIQSCFLFCKENKYLFENQKQLLYFKENIKDFEEKLI